MTAYALILIPWFVLVAVFVATIVTTPERTPHD